MMRVRVCPIADVPNGEVIKAELPGRCPIALYNLDGEYYATDDLCTHGEASLSEGVIEGDQIVCPFHGGTFDIRSGEATGSPCYIPLKTFPVHVEDGELHVELPRPE